ncbi:MAG: polysaccharide deacetylase family protein [Pseudomonadota bacterium]
MKHFVFLSLISLASIGLMGATCSQQPDIEAEQQACPPPARSIEAAPKGAPISGQLSPGEVILTFDDGPHRARTPHVLDVLAEACAPATFFLRGDAAARHPARVREIATRGHTLGGHGWAHANLTDMSSDAALADIERGNSAIEAAFDNAPDAAPISLFRFPFVATTPALSAEIAAAGLVEVGVDVDGQDWTGNSAEEIVDIVMRRLEDRGRRGIILLHDPFDNSVAATRLLLEKLALEDYEIVALTPAPAN